VLSNGNTPRIARVLLVMISIDKCEEVLNKHQKKYSTEQIKAIREYLYQMTLVIDEIKPKKDE